MKKLLAILLWLPIAVAHGQVEPTTQAFNLAASPVTSASVNLTWSNGNGNGRIVIAVAAPTISVTPTDGTTNYIPNSTFGSGTNLGSNHYTVYKATGTSVTVSNLIFGTTYTFAVFEYNLATGNYNYNVSLGPGNMVTMVLGAEPTIQASNVVVTGSTPTSAMISWTNGNGNGRMVVAALGASITAFPIDGTTNYNANSTFGNGFNLGGGNYVVFKSTGSSVTVSGLNTGVQYSFAVLEYTFLSPNYNYNINLLGTNQGSIVMGQDALIMAGLGYPSIPSTATSQAQRANVFDFSIIDNGNDGGDLRFLGITFRPGPGNFFSDFTQLVSDVEFDCISGCSGSGNSNITSTMIQINGINDCATCVGRVNDGSVQNYRLKLWLKAPLGGTLPATADNMNLVLSVASTDILLSPSTNSYLYPGSTDSGITNGKLTVAATKLLFVTPPVTSYVNAPMNPVPVVQAVDANNNYDIDINGGTAGLTSTGTLQSAVTGTFLNGVANYTPIIHTAVATNRTLTTTNTFGLTNAPSTPFNILSASTLSDIIANTSFVYPTNIAYDQFQENTNITTGATSLEVAKFDIRDGGATPDGDPFATVLTNLTLNLGTNFGFIRRIALYDATGLIELAETAVSTQNVSFSGLNVIAGDDGSTSFIVRASFTTAVTDNQQFSFTISSATAQATNSTFINASAGSAVSSTAGNINRIEVTATKLLYTQQPTNVFITGVMSPSPGLEAVDAFNKRDLDYVTNVSVTSTGTLNSSPQTATPVAGLASFSSIIHTATGSGLTLSASSGSLTGAMSTSFTVSPPATVSTITAGAAAPATISSLVNTVGAAVTVFNFIVNDDPAGTPPASNDASATLISALTITQRAPTNFIADWTEAIAGATLTDGTNSMAATSINATNIVFSSINTANLGLISDNGSKTYSLRIYLKASLGGSLPTTIDGLGLGFEILQANITTSAAGTSILAGQSQNSGSANVVAVVATQLRFTSPAAPTQAFLNTAFSGATVEATDINLNRDLGYSGASSTVRELTNASSDIMSNGPVIGTTQFTAGILNFSGSFQFTSGINGDNVTLTIKAGTGPGTTCGVNSIICGTSAAITLSTSGESTIFSDPTYTFASTIDYRNFQATDILNTGTSLEIARMLLIDGSRVSFTYGSGTITTGTDIDATPNSDLDGASTVLTSLTLRVSNPSNLRRIALYSNGVEVSGTEQDVTAIGAINSSTATYDFVFNGSPLLTATDNGITPLSVRVSFRNTSPEVTDNEAINIQVIAATLSGGSAFYSSAGYVAGVFGGYQSQGGMNIITATATELRFLQQPSAVLIGVAMSPNVTIQATDNMGVRDLDAAGSVTITSTGVLGTAVSATLATGFATTTAINHTDKQTGVSLSTTNLLGLSNATSTTFNVTASLTSDITHDATFVPTNDIQYRNFQATDITGGANDIALARFIIRDGGGSSDPDGGSTLLKDITFTITNVSILRRVALYDNSGTELAELAATSPLTFSNLNAGVGYGPGDNTTRFFQVRVSYQATVTDNLRNVFTVTNATTTVKSSDFATAAAGGAASPSTTTANQIEVIASQLSFGTNLNTSLLANKDIGAQQSVPVIKAVDQLNNTDLDYATNVTLSSAISISTPTLTVDNPAPNAGVYSFPSGFRYAAAGNGTITATSGALTQVVSAAVTVTNGAVTTLTAGASGSPTISSLINTVGAAVDVLHFTVNDDPAGTPGPQDDGTPTLITQMIFVARMATNTIADWTDAIAGASLTDGTTTLSTATIAAASITFSSINTASLGLVADNASKTYTLKIYLKNPLGGTLPTTIDGATLGIEIATANITTNPTGGSIASAQLQHSGTANVVAVVATKLDFTTPPSALIDISTSFASALVVEARDANNNRDLGFNSTISAFSNAGGLTMNNAPSVGNPFVAGVFTFNAAFQYAASGDGSLTLTAGGLTKVAAVMVRSKLSDITYTGGSSSTINYTSYIAPFPAVLTTSNTANLGNFQIRDNLDPDNLATTLITLNLQFANFSNLDRVALFENSTLFVAEMPVANDIVNFTGLSLAASDNNTKNFSVRATFKTTVVDNQPVQVTIVGAAASASGSYFELTDGGGATSGPTLNKIVVTADRLAFPSPSATAQVNQNFGLTVMAVDANSNIDQDITSSVTLSKFSGSAPAVLTSTDAGGLIRAMASGTVSWSQLKYTVAEPCAIQATALGLTTAFVSVTVQNPAGAPAGQVTNLAFSSVTPYTLTLNMTPPVAGGGAFRLVVAKSGSVVDQVPNDGQTYTPNVNFGSGSSLGGGNFVVGLLSGATGGPLNVTGLSAGTTYHFRAFEFNGSGGSESYNITTATNNPNSVTTLPVPTITSFNPTHGVEGASVTITGTNFSTTPSSNDVKFNGVAATITGTPTTTSIVTSVPVGATTGTITVTVGGYTGISSSNFTVDLDATPPTFGTDHTARSIASGQDLPVSSDFIDAESGIASAKVLYRSTNLDAAYSEMYMVHGAGNTWSTATSVLAAAFGELGLEYKYVIVNGVGLEATSPLHGTAVNFESGIPMVINSTFTKSQSSYRIIAIPLVLSPNSVNAVFSEEFGTYDESVWRIYHYENGSMNKLGGSSLLDPGKGYWFISTKAPTGGIATGPGTTVGATSDGPFETTIFPGWNQIGNPYNYDISWSDVLDANPGLTLGPTARSYNGSIIEIDEIKKFEGAYISFTGSTSTRLKIPVTKNNSINGRKKGRTSDTNPPGSESWEVRVHVSIADQTYNLGGVGMHPDAKDGIDPHDDFNVPRFFDFIELRHPKQFADMSFTMDVVPTQENYVWNFTTETNAHGSTIRLNWDNAYFAGGEGEMWLMDVASGMVWDMRKVNTAISEFSSVRQWRISFGNEAFVHDATLPDEPVLLNAYPNPFGNKVSFDWALNETGPVQLEVLDLTGRPVALLVDKVVEKGRYTTAWEEGIQKSAAPGVYLVRFRAGATSQYKRIIKGQ